MYGYSFSYEPPFLKYNDSKSSTGNNLHNMHTFHDTYGIVYLVRIFMIKLTSNGIILIENEIFKQIE